MNAELDDNLAQAVLDLTELKDKLRRQGYGRELDFYDLGFALESISSAVLLLIEQEQIRNLGLHTHVVNGERSRHPEMYGLYQIHHTHRVNKETFLDRQPLTLDHEHKTSLTSHGLAAQKGE